MKSRVFFFVGAGVSALGLLILMFISLALGFCIMCLGGCGTMAVATLCNPGMFGDFDQPNGWYIKFMWITAIVGFGLIAIAPIVLLIGITVFASA